MHQFNHPLTTGVDPFSDTYVLGLSANGYFVTDPYLSQCGRFEVANPEEVHGISAEDAQELKKLNDILAKAVESAINAGCLAIQNAIGVDDGGFAGVFFSGGEQRQGISKDLALYMIGEYQSAMNG